MSEPELAGKWFFAFASFTNSDRRVACGEFLFGDLLVADPIRKHRFSCEYDDRYW